MKELGLCTVTLCVFEYVGHMLALINDISIDKRFHNNHVYIPPGVAMVL